MSSPNDKVANWLSSAEQIAIYGLPETYIFKGKFPDREAPVAISEKNSKVKTGIEPAMLAAFQDLANGLQGMAGVMMDEMAPSDELNELAQEVSQMNAKIDEVIKTGIEPAMLAAFQDLANWLQDMAGVMMAHSDELKELAQEVSQMNAKIDEVMKNMAQ